MTAYAIEEAEARYDDDLKRHIIEQFLIALGPIWEVSRFVYNVSFWSWRGQTIAMMMLGIKIVRTDGSAIGLWVAIRRYAGTIVSMMIVFVGYFMMIWDSRRQGLHDKMADTLVVRTR